MRKESDNIDRKDFEDLWITIPKGEVQMRDDRTKKSWIVAIETFQLAKFPVSQSLYQFICGENPSTFQGENLPVETVSWLEAITFCNKLSEFLELDPYYILDIHAQQISHDSGKNGIRLPSEAEWQYACQAGTREIRYGAINDIAWYKNNSMDQTQAVGKKLPNQWGLYDMLGNVWEWCSDIYDESVYGKYRVFRGGGFCDEERGVMATNRRRSHPSSFKIEDLGFRIATNAIPK